MRGFDQTVFHWINGWPDWLNPLFYFLSEGNKQWPVRVGLFAVLALFFVKGGKWRLASVLAILCWLVSNEVCDQLKNFFEMPRPCVELPESEVILRVKRLTSFGTASAHSASMMTVAVVFSSLLGRWGWPWVVLAVGVGLSRIYVGVHYPYQVLFGWAVGAFIAWMGLESAKAFESLRQKRREKVDGVEPPRAASEAESGRLRP